MAASTTRKKLSNRPLDTIYTVWFSLHLVIMICVDLTALYPKWLMPAPLMSLREWQMATYKDRFFIDPPAWFLSFVWMEALYHVPLSVWAVGALLRDSPLVPVHLLVWAVQTAVTTMVCIVDYSSWGNFSVEDRMGLHRLYGPYLVLAVGMGIGMFLRLRTKLLAGAQGRAKSD